MKKLEKALPYLILISFLSLCHFKETTIADSIILIALAGFAGFRSYLNYKEVPDYVEIFRKELDEKSREIQDLKNAVGMSNIAKQRKDNIEKMVW